MKLRLNIVRTINKLIKATQNERLFTERLFKDKRVYNYLDVPDSAFKTNFSLLK